MKLKNPLLKELIAPKEVLFEKVITSFGKENDVNSKHGRLVMEVLEATNKNLKFWVEARLPSDVLLNTIIARHQHGELEISPSQGSTVKEAFEKILSYGENYSKKCSNCVKIINSFKKKIPGHIYLAAEKPNNLYGYPRFKYYKDRLVFLDGLHRMLAASYQISENKYTPIKCFVAFKK